MTDADVVASISTLLDQVIAAAGTLADARLKRRAVSWSQQLQRHLAARLDQIAFDDNPPPTGQDQPKDSFQQMWRDWFTKLDADPAWDQEFDARLKCSICAEHWKQFRASRPAVYGPGRFEYCVAGKNFVNAFVRGKVQVSVEEARKLCFENYGISV
jgi:hypothetical protein